MQLPKVPNPYTLINFDSVIKGSEPFDKCSERYA